MFIYARLDRVDSTVLFYNHFAVFTEIEMIRDYM